MTPLEEQFTDLEAPAAGALWEVPFVVVCYLPTLDGKNIDSELTGYKGTVTQLHDRILRLVRVSKWMMEEGSRYHGYRDPKALPSLGYRCVRYITYFEDIPRGRSAGANGVCFPDYKAIIERVGSERLVNQGGVKEFWVYHWHHGLLAPIETNMASRITGDISNSDRLPDLPIYNNSYLVIGANFDRGPDKQVHNMGHQMEVELRFISQKQERDTHLFDGQFCGVNARGQFETGRCGNTHFPPNGAKDYDYYNRTPVLSDIEDWTPEGTGIRKPISCTTWETLPYRFPTGDRIHQRGTVLEPDAHWYLYWFQNFPGRDNHIPYSKGEITNWWRFLGDWDGAVREDYGLWKQKKDNSVTVATAPSSLLPGEMGLEGIVHATRPGVIFLVADRLTFPGKEPITLSPARKKEILSDDAQKFSPGSKIAVIGISLGDGKPLRARWAAKKPF